MRIILKVFAGEIACQPGRLPLIALPRYPRWAGLAERNGYPHIRLESEAPWELNKYDFDLKLAKNRKGQQPSGGSGGARSVADLGWGMNPTIHQQTSA